MCHLQGEFAWLSRVSLVSDHFNIIIYYCYYYHHYYLNFWCRSDTVRINQIPVFSQNISCIFSSNYLVSSQVIQILRNKTFTRKCLLKIRIQYNIILSEKFTRAHSCSRGSLSFRSHYFGCVFINLLHYNIGIYTLQTVLFAFLLVITRRICLTIRSFLCWWSFPYY